MELGMNEVLIGISSFFGMTIATKLIEGYFAKKTKAEDQIDVKIENDIRQVLDQLRSMNLNITELATKLSVNNERVDMLFKMSNDNATRINKLTDDLLTLYKNLKAN